MCQGVKSPRHDVEPMSDSTNRRVAVVTGANAGVGKHTSLGFARLGFHVILCSRSEARGEAAAEWIRSCCPDASAEVVPLDLQDFHSVLRCADMIIAKAFGVIHALVLNAGIGGLGSLPDWSKPTAKGVNMIFQVNFVAQFLLLRRLEARAYRASLPSRTRRTRLSVRRRMAAIGTGLIYAHTFDGIEARFPPPAPLGSSCVPPCVA